MLRKTFRKKKRGDKPVRVIPMKYQFLVKPSKTFNLLSSLRQLTELKICAKTNALKTRVCTIESFLVFTVLSEEVWKPRIRLPRKWKMSVMVI